MKLFVFFSFKCKLKPYKDTYIHHELVHTNIHIIVYNSKYLVYGILNYNLHNNVQVQVVLKTLRTHPGHFLI